MKFTTELEIEVRLHGKPVLVETEDTKIADAIRSTATRSYAADDPLAEETILGHGPCEVIAILPQQHQDRIVAEYQKLGYEFADPVTFCKYIQENGWPYVDHGSSHHIYTQWKGSHLEGYSFSMGQRLDFRDYKIECVVIVLMKRERAAG